MSIGPWFKCYPSNWLEGVRDLSLPAQGAYSHLLMRMYDAADAIPDDAKRIGRWLNSNAAGWRKVRKELIEEGKLTVLSDGRLINRRALIEMHEQSQGNKKVPQNIRERIAKLLDMFPETFAKHIEKLSESSSENALETRPLIEARSQKPDKKDKTKVLSKKDSENSPVEKPKPKKRGPPRKTSLKENWQPTPQDIAFAVTKGLNSDEIRNEADRFYRYHRAKGSTWKDWHLVWCNWINSDFGPIARKRKAEHSAIAGGRSSAIDAALDAAAHQLDAFTFANGGRQEYHAANASPGSATSRSEAEILDADGFVLARG